MKIEIKNGKQLVVTSSAKLSNRQWHKEGKPNWWAKRKENEEDQGEFLRIGYNRGDTILEITIPYEGMEGKFLQIGVGREQKIREMEYIPNTPP